LLVALYTPLKPESKLEIAQCVAEINALKGQIRARITLLACDAELLEEAPWIYEPWEDFNVPNELIGGGGTAFFQ
jgi:predicted metal-dependent peptidase